MDLMPHVRLQGTLSIVNRAQYSWRDSEQVTYQNNEPLKDANSAVVAGWGICVCHISSLPHAELRPESLKRHHWLSPPAHDLSKRQNLYVILNILDGGLVMGVVDVD